MYTRIPTFKVSPDRIDSATRWFQDVALPQLQRLQGFKGATMLVDRDKGMVRVVGFWEDRRAVDNSESTTKTLREDFSKQMEGETLSVEIWEVTVDFYPEAMREMAGAAAARTM